MNEVIFATTKLAQMFDNTILLALASKHLSTTPSLLGVVTRAY